MENEKEREIAALRARIADFDTRYPVQIMVPKPERGIGFYLEMTAIAVGGFLAFAMFIGSLDSRTQVQRNHDYCVEEAGFGDWVGSSGMTLDRYCTGYADLKSIEQDKRAHPENY